jgi:uncharacterized protein DUF5681
MKAGRRKMLKIIEKATMAASPGSENSATEEGGQTTTPASADSEKAKCGRWGKGTSGNPAGRPKGSRNRVTLLREYLSEDQQEQLLHKLIEFAMAGDKHAMSLCVDRLIPRCIESSIEFELGPTGTYEGVCAAASNVLAAVAFGKITASQGERITKMLEFRGQLFFGLSAK